MSNLNLQQKLHLISFFSDNRFQIITILIMASIKPFQLFIPQDLLIKLDMKPCKYASSKNKHFSLTKLCHPQTYWNYEQPPQTSQNSYFQSYFFVFKIGQIFPKKKFYEEYSTRRPTFIKKCFWKFWFLRYFIF